jgi:hypothetical protein
VTVHVLTAQRVIVRLVTALQVQSVVHVSHVTTVNHSVE